MAVNVAKRRALGALCARRGWGLLFTDGYRTLQDVQHHTVDATVATALRQAVESTDCLTWKDMRTLRQRVCFTHRDLAALVLLHDWEWRTGPYRLCTRSPEAVDRGGRSSSD